MARAKSQFICQQCGTSYPKWVGKCDNCGEWNSLVEQPPVDAGASAVARSSGKGKAFHTLRLSETAAEAKQARLATGIADLDAVLGGGFCQVVWCWWRGSRNWKKYPASTSRGVYCPAGTSALCQR